MKRRTLGLMLAVCLAVGLLAPAGAAEASGARVLLEAGKPDADGCFTVAMRIYNAAFNAFQFVLWYDGDTVRPVDASGQETQRFSPLPNRRMTAGWPPSAPPSIRKGD